MNERPIEIVCCGHVCLDIIPRMGAAQLPPPGGLTQVGPADIATGGSVSNTGLALHKLGLGVRLVGGVGDDAFGREVRQRYEQAGEHLADWLRVVSDEPTSYTVVINPPTEDRRFLHCPGINDTFTDADVSDEALRGAKLMHFGYPPIMKAMCAQDGAPLVRLFQRAHRAGLWTSLDLCGVSPHGWASEIAWEALLKNVLPHVDAFLPSMDELRTMTDASPDELLSWGCRLVMIKDGERGLMIHTSPDAEVLGPGWGSRVLHAPTFKVDVVGTTGAGDTTIAGFLAGLVRGETLEMAADLACATGAHCVQAADATSGLCSLQQLHDFLTAKPPRRKGNTS